MKANFYHIKLNVSNPEFYKSFLQYLGFKTTHEFATGFGSSDGKVSIWVFKTKKGHEKESHFEDTGLNHLAFKVESRTEVDKFYKNYLLANKIPILYEPVEYPQYNQDKGYYAVFFESPDHIKLEVVWVAE